MGQPIEITQTELSVSALRAVAGKTDDSAVMRRLLAVALVLDDHSRTAAALLNGTTRQTLRDSVHRYNAEGVAGLRSRTGPGRPPFLTSERMEDLREIVLKGPDPKRHTVIRWRCVDLCAELVDRIRHLEPIRCVTGAEPRAGMRPGQAGWPRQRTRSARSGTCGLAGTASLAPR